MNCNLWRSHGRIFVGRNFVSGICKLKPKKTFKKLKTYFFVKQPWFLPSLNVNWLWDRRLSLCVVQHAHWTVSRAPVREQAGATTVTKDTTARRNISAPVRCYLHHFSLAFIPQTYYHRGSLHVFHSSNSVFCRFWIAISLQICTTLVCLVDWWQMCTALTN